VKNLLPLHLWLLKKFCDKYDIDYEEIDDTLTYWENRGHLKSLALGPMPDYGSLRADLGGLSDWEERLAEWESQMEWYLENHFLEYYLACIKAGWTVSEDVGEVSSEPQMFSLKAMAPVGFSLQHLRKA